MPGEIPRFIVIVGENSWVLNQAEWSKGTGLGP